MRIGMLQLAALICLGVWVVRRARGGPCGGFDAAWVGLSVGVALMLSRSWFALGAVVAGASFAAITLPMARVEWQRRTARDAR